MATKYLYAVGFVFDGGFGDTTVIWPSPVTSGKDKKAVANVIARKVKKVKKIEMRSVRIVDIHLLDTNTR